MSASDQNVNRMSSATDGRAAHALFNTLLIGLVLCVALKDWFVSSVPDYPYAVSTAATLAILAPLLAMRWVRNTVTWQIGITWFAAFLAFSELALQYTAGHLDPDLSIKMTDALGSWLSADTTTAIGLWSLAVSIPSLVSLASCRSISSVRLPIGIKVDISKLLAINLDYSALRFGCAVAGLFCLAEAQKLPILVGLKLVVVIPIALCISALIAGYWWPKNQNSMRPSVLSATFFLCIASYFYPMYNYIQHPITLTRSFLLGSGLSNNGDGSVAAFIGEQGLLAWVVFGLVLATIGFRSLTHTLRLNSQAQAERPELELTSISLITIALYSIYGLTFSNPLTLLIAGLSIISLFAVIPREQSSGPMPVKFRRFICASAGVFILSMSVWVVAWYRFADRMATVVPNNISGPFCFWKDTPAAVQNSLASIPIRSTLAQDHLLLRYFCGANVYPPDSMARVIAIQQTRIYTARNPYSFMALLVLQHFIGTQLSDERVKELYLNCRSYGNGPSSPGQEVVGITQAAAVFFGTSVGGLNDPESRYLVMSYPETSEPRFYFRTSGVPPVTQSAPATVYQYTEFSKLPDMNFMLHDGQINDDGIVACSVLTFHNGLKPFNWQACHYKMLSGLSVPPNGIPTGINGAGVSVGTSDGGAVQWDTRGSAHELALLPGFNLNSATAINNSGQIVGYCYNETSTGSAVDNLSHAVEWDAGVLHDLGVPAGYSSTRAYAINNYGLIAGFAVTSSGKSHAVVWENGQMHDLGTYPDGDISRANAINDAGDVVGQGTHENGTVTAFLWRSGVMHDLGLLSGDVYSRARSINDSGTIVGEGHPQPTYVDTTGGRAFIWDPAHGMRDLMPMAAVDAANHLALERACAVFSTNNRGQVLGINRRYPGVPGNEVNFVLTPLSCL